MATGGRSLDPKSTKKPAIPLFPFFFSPRHPSATLSSFSLTIASSAANCLSFIFFDSGHRSSQQCRPNHQLNLLITEISLSSEPLLCQPPFSATISATTRSANN
jgi:hypothetical protein